MKPKHLKNITLSLLTLFALAFFYFQKDPVSEVKSDSISNEYKVTKVVDGDTIEVQINGKKEKIRIIGLDTPETVDPKQPVQCYGNEASVEAKTLLQDKQVSLESDPTQENIDKYGRLLRYVFLPDGTNFSQKMISDGFGYEYTYDKAYLYQKDFKDAEAQAKEKKLGLWADETCKGQR